MAASVQLPANRMQLLALPQYGMQRDNLKLPELQQRLQIRRLTPSRQCALADDPV
jgi:hypothetical protein